MRGQRIRAGQQPVRLSFLAVALLALVGGCSSADAESQPRAELPPASTSAAESTPELPPLGPEDFPVPDEARTQDEAGAEAFARYYVDLLNHEQRKPSGDAIRALGPTCEDCLAIARRLEESAEAGYRIKGGALTVIDEAGVSLKGGRAEVAFFASVEPVAAYDASGNAVPDSAFPAQENLSSGLRLTWDDEQTSWLVEALTIG